MATATIEATSHICYLSAADVRSPVGYLSGLELRGQDNERLGRLAGVLIDIERGRLCALVVQPPGRRGRCCLVDPDELVCLDTNYRTLRVAAPAAGARAEFDLDWLRYDSDPALQPVA